MSHDTSYDYRTTVPGDLWQSLQKALPRSRPLDLEALARHRHIWHMIEVSLEMTCGVRVETVKPRSDAPKQIYKKKPGRPRIPSVKK